MATTTLAVKLKRARVRSKLSMSQVSRTSIALAKDSRSKITQGYISRLESGKETNPSLLKVKMFCKIYRLKPEELF